MYLLHDTELSQVLIKDGLCQVDSDICLSRSQDHGYGEQELHLGDGDSLEEGDPFD